MGHSLVSFAHTSLQLCQNPLFAVRTHEFGTERTSETLPVEEMSARWDPYALFSRSVSINTEYALPLLFVYQLKHRRLHLEGFELLEVLQVDRNLQDGV